MKPIQVVISWTMLVAVALFPVAVVAQTAQQIVDNVVDQLNNVADYTADIDIDYADISVPDMSDGTIQEKRVANGPPKAKMVMGSGYSGYILSNGAGWNYFDKFGALYYHNQADGQIYVRGAYGSDLFNMERVLATESWTKAGSTTTINSVSCFKVYTSKLNRNYEVWIDEGTYTKVVRVKATDENDDLQWQLDYSNYSNVESTAYLPGTIVSQRFVDDVAVVEATCDFSNININESLSNSVFDIWEP